MKKLFALLTILAVLAGCLSCGARTPEPVGIGRSEVAQRTDPGAVDPPQTGPAPPAFKDELTVVMVGDVLLHEPLTESGLADDGSRNYDHFFANVRETVESADLALVNEEVILGGEELGLSGYPRFNGPYEVADAEAAAGFDVILQATNHALDRGGDGIRNDLAYWRANYPEIAVAGIYDSAAARDEICTVEIEGVRVAVLNYTYSTNGREMPDGMPWAVAMLDETGIRADFSRAREQADFIIVCPHWGTEYSHQVSDSQRRWADLFLEEGADLILGAHPHVIEPLETLTAPDGKQVPVYWSVGNFINSTAGEGPGVADRMLGAMAAVTLKIDRADDGSVTGVSVASCKALPLVTHMAFGFRAPTTYFLADYTEDLAAANRVSERDPAFSVAYLTDLWNKVMENDQ